MNKYYIILVTSKSYGINKIYFTQRVIILLFQCYFNYNSPILTEELIEFTIRRTRGEHSDCFQHVRNCVANIRHSPSLALQTNARKHSFVAQTDLAICCLG